MRLVDGQRDESSYSDDYLFWKVRVERCGGERRSCTPGQMKPARRSPELWVKGSVPTGFWARSTPPIRVPLYRCTPCTSTGESAKAPRVHPKMMLDANVPHITISFITMTPARIPISLNRFLRRCTLYLFIFYIHI